MSATSGFASSLALDIYPPRPPLETAGPPLAVLLLQGIGIDKAEYAKIATELSRQHLWVVVPNCVPARRDYVCLEGSSVAGALASPETARFGDLVEALRSGLVLFGHSAGGIAAFEALRAGSPKLPTKPVAIATYGSNAPFEPGVDPPLPPVLMLSGQNDAVVPPEITRSAFRKLLSSSKTLVELAGLNHYSINGPRSPPRLSAWVVRVTDIRAAAAAEPLGNVEPMSRGALDWLITIPSDGSVPLGGVAPALIEWHTDTHPAAKLEDRGLSLAKLVIRSSEPDRISQLLRSLELDAPVSVVLALAGESPRLVAHINTPPGLRLLSVPTRQSAGPTA